MQPSFSDAAKTLAQCLTEMAESRPEVRRALELVREQLLAWSPPGSDRGPGVPFGSTAGSAAVEAGATARPASGSRTGYYEKVVTGRDRRVEHLPGRSPGGETRGAPAVDRHGRERRPPDLRMIAKRASWKADAVRWAIERRRWESGESIDAGASRAIESELRARREELEECFGWMLDRYRTLPQDEALQHIAQSYDNVALAAECTLTLISAGVLDPAPPPELLYALAETQSALLAALGTADLRSDSDQRDLFLWLKNQTLRHRIYVDRHMKLDDPAEHRDGERRAERLRRLTESLIERKQVQRRQVNLLGKLRYHITKLGEYGMVAGSDLESICAALGEWIRAGDSPRHPRLLEVLAPLPAILGDSPPPEPLDALWPDLVDKPDLDDATGAQAARRQSAVARASALLKGLRAVVLGGELGQDERDELVRGLSLASVDWKPLGKDASESLVREAVATAEVNLVLIVTRLTEASYDAFKAACKERELPFVRLPGGVTPADVAQQVLRQVGRLLQERSSLAAGI